MGPVGTLWNRGAWALCAVFSTGHFEALVRLARCPLRAFSEEALEETRLSDYKNTRTSCERSAGVVLVVQSSTPLQSAPCVFKRVKQVEKAV